MMWTILGFSVAIIAVFCVSVAELFVGKPIFENHREYIAATLVVCGVAAWFLGRVLVARRRNDDAPEGETSNRFILFDLRYWGPMLLALGIITLFIRPLKQQVEHTRVATAPPPPPPTNKVVPPPKPAPEPIVARIPAVFPKLKMQGVIFRETQPFAIINGQSYTVGDRLGDVLVKSIDRASVILELQGELQVLTLN